MSAFAGESRPSGTLTLTKLHRWPSNPSLIQILQHGIPRVGLQPGIAKWRFRNLPNLWRGLWRLLVARLTHRVTGLPFAYGSLYLEVIHQDGTRTQYGLASLRVVTTAGVNYLVDSLQNLTEPENLKFHGFGTGTTAEAVGDTALVTEETTQYAVDNTRPTGSLTEGASANIFRTVGTYSPDSGTSPRPITEHGIFSQAATGGGTLLDRSVFSAVNLVTNADSLQATYDFTINSGG